jgi:hypothetical protein
MAGRRYYRPIWVQHLICVMEVVIHSRRQMISCLALSALAAPLTFRFDLALARGDDRDGGNRGGDADSGAEGGNGGRGGKAGDSSGGETRGSERSGDHEGRRSADDARDNSSSDGPNDAGREQSQRLRIRHGNGIAEEVNDRGRYVMRDNRGRTIVDRVATRSDIERLRSLVD